MIGAKETYCMYISFAGCLYFLFITLACFFGMEVLKLKEGTRASRGFAAFLVAVVNNINNNNFLLLQIYGGIAGYIYYKKYNEEERLKVFYNIEQEDAKLKNNLMIEY